MNTDGTGFHTCTKNATKPNPFQIIPLQTTRKENNWMTEEALARAAVTLEMERIKGSNPICFLWWWWYIDIHKKCNTIKWKLIVISLYLKYFSQFYFDSTYAHLEQNLSLLYSFAGDLPEDGRVEATTCTRHTGKWQVIVCCWLYNCWIKWYIISLLHAI